MKQAHTLLDEAIKQDPEYPLNYYNLACAYAEEGNKTGALTNLSLAFERKEHMLKGEKMRDPRDQLFLPEISSRREFHWADDLQLEGPGVDVLRHPFAPTALLPPSPIPS